MVVEGGNHLEGWIIFVSLFFVGVDGYIYIYISQVVLKKKCTDFCWKKSIEKEVNIG